MADVDRPALEALWRNRLKDARLRLDFARNYVTEIQRDFSSNELPSPDGHYALGKALRGETAALREYHRILRIFADIVTKGNIPKEKDWPRQTTGGEGE